MHLNGSVNGTKNVGVDELQRCRVRRERIMNRLRLLLANWQPSQRTTGLLADAFSIRFPCRLAALTSR